MKDLFVLMRQKEDLTPISLADIIEIVKVFSLAGLQCKEVVGVGLGKINYRIVLPSKVMMNTNCLNKLLKI